MGEYSANVQATTNTSTNTSDTFIEIKAAASTTYRVKRVRVTYGDGTQTAGVDNVLKIMLYRWTTASAGSGTSFTPIKKDPLSPASGATCVIKNGTTALALGSTTEICDVISPNGRAAFEWVARDEDDYWRLVSGACFAIVIASPVASQKVACTLEWVE